MIDDKKDLTYVGCRHLINQLKSTLHIGDTILLKTQRDTSLEKTQFQQNKLSWVITGIYPTMIKCTRYLSNGRHLDEFFLYHEILLQHS